MCLYGVYKWVNIINPNQNKKVVAVDACIANEVQMLNDKGINTLGSCCGHGKAGQISDYTNAFGNWKSHEYPPHVLIDEMSSEFARSLGYRPYPYIYADGVDDGVLIMYLKSGCLTEDDCEEWYNENNIPFIKNVGAI